ncbi:cystathionine gamma-synthase [Egibacter rhizosphaerae]|uniref:Cystathionine gamma-synthase n=1 Tax=Egibacter rhizosphaerae TaxID=1670831 RepID=A0A411YCZ9_9ACTN|nr:cystathionine gamma-synthase [Egibacter rhizosphaerae]QBI19068.1 cystathionine gamma-synthase [Egibacter rhizosphaerae]
MPSSRWDTTGLATRAIHAGQDPDPRTGAVMTPIYQTSTFAQTAVGEHAGWDYARGGNPTRDALEEAIASLEVGPHGVAFSSGLAASDAVLRQLRPGDHVVMANDVYGGTYRQLAKVHAPWGLTFDPVNLGDLDAVAAAFRPQTRILWVESPTNPLLTVFDIAALAELAHERDISVVVDNTFATPVLQTPLSLGADVVVHSTTKYLGGHSDVVGGAVVTNDDDRAAAYRFHANAVGAVPGPWDCFLVLRGLKTLPVRMRAHMEGAARVVEAAQTLAGVREVLWPGLPGHPGHEITERQMCGPGGMVSLRLADGETARRACERFTVFTLAESLGGVESLVEHPAAMTHASTADSPIAVPGDLVRLSVGLEDPEDLAADLQQAVTGAR